MTDPHIEHIPDNEHFVRLVKLAREDSGLRQELSGLLALDDNTRRHVLDVILTRMKENREPVDVIAAFAYLRDHEVAVKVKELLRL